MSKSKSEVKARAELIRVVFGRVKRLCDKYRGDRELARSVECATRGEREHRAIGRRMVGDAVRARVSVETAAHFFAIRGFFCARKKRSFTDRDDFVAAYGAAERVERWGPEAAAAYRALRRERDTRAVLALDYIDLVESSR